MMNNNSHQYYYPPPPASSSVSMNSHSTGEKMNGDALHSDGVPSGSSGTGGASASSGKYYHATTTSTSNNEEREVEAALREAVLREVASSSIMSSTASIMMMNNNSRIVDAQPLMVVPLAYHPSVAGAVGLGFMSTMGGGALSGGLMPPSSQQQPQRQAHQQPHRNQHQQQQVQQQQTHVQQAQQQQHTQQAQQQHNSRLAWRNGEKTFPYKVYDMLEYAVTNGFENVCSWTVVDDGVVGGSGGDAGGGGGGEGGSGGDAFVIHNRELFTETILPKFFVHKNWRSFTRQLNIWCFKRTYTNMYTRGVAKSDCYSHPNFKRNQYDQIGLVTRSESKGAFKKDPLTKRRVAANTTATSSSTATTSSVGKEGGISTINNTSGSNKRRRSQQDMHEVATFLAGLKSNSATTTTSDKDRNNNDSIEGEGSQLTLSSPGLHAAAYQDAVLELQQQLQKEGEEVECNVDNNTTPLASYSKHCSVEPPPEGTLWTCEKCKVAQFVAFDEAVEHERCCTY